MKDFDYNDIIDDIDIINELEDRGISGKVVGHNYMFNCPYHDEKNPSFGISIYGNRKGLFQCFSCGQKGNFFHLISYLDEESFSKTIKSFVREDIDVKSIMNLKNHFFNNFSKANEREKIRVIKKDFLEKFKKPYGCFFEYLVCKRKLNKDIIREFNILCCDEGKWKDRVIVPWYDDKKRLIGVDARKIYETDKAYKIRKIKNSDIGKIVFGIDSIKYNSKIVLVEGSFDAMYLRRFGIPSGALGTKNINKYQINMLLKKTNEVVLSLDGDIPYDSKDNKFISIKKIKEKLSPYFGVEIVKLKENKDPNDLTSEEVRKYYSKYL